MEFSIEKVAKDYIYRRYPRATVLEKEKYVTDWRNKIRDSKALVEDFKKRVGEPAGKKVLDAGCGNGGISIAFAMAGAEAHGVEVEDELFQISKQHAQALGINANFYLYNGDRLPFEDDFFDYAVSASVLEHTDDPVHYLNEILRTMKPGGKLYLGFPNKLAPRETHTQLMFLTYLPKFLQDFYIKIFHRNPLPDNSLHFYGYFDLLRMIGGGVGGYRWKVLEEEGGSKNILKKVIKKTLRVFGLSYKALLPHILVILQKEKIK
jgi:2-polyprenyl-3-methyl-5-hydroxy-6-metoxy-1,4-benzoquinol methylase